MGKTYNSRSKTRPERRKWCPEEDTLLQKAIEKHGTKNWGVVAAAIRGRHPKQCRERWINHLDPQIVKGKMTDEEWDIVVKTHQQQGNRWSEIAKLLPGRTPNQIKNYWHTMARRSDKQNKDEEEEEANNYDNADREHHYQMSLLRLGPHITLSQSRHQEHYGHQEHLYLGTSNLSHHQHYRPPRSRSPHSPDHFYHPQEHQSRYQQHHQHQQLHQQQPPQHQQSIDYGDAPLLPFQALLACAEEMNYLERRDRGPYARPERDEEQNIHHPSGGGVFRRTHHTPSRGHTPVTSKTTSLTTSPVHSRSVTPVSSRPPSRSSSPSPLPASSPLTPSLFLSPLNSNAISPAASEPGSPRSNYGQHLFPPSSSSHHHFGPPRQSSLGSLRDRDRDVRRGRPSNSLPSHPTGLQSASRGAGFRPTLSPQPLSMVDLEEHIQTIEEQLFQKFSR